MRLKILVSAYACNPYKGSESGVGWGWVKTIAPHHELWVITAEYNRADIEKEALKPGESRANIHFHYVPHKTWHYRPGKVWSAIENSILKPVMNTAYRLWQRDCYRVAIELHKQHAFDLVHQLTYVGFRFPGHLWKLDIPFVWGPIGGLENTPWRFFTALGINGCIYYASRNIINSLHKRFLPGPKKAFRKARGGIISATEGIRREIYRWYSEDSEVICEIGPPPATASDHSIRNPGEHLKIAWSGQHVSGKALPLLLRALAMLPEEVDWKLYILGQGPCTAKWKSLAEKLKIGSRCIWAGQLIRTEALNRVHQSHLFVITSLKDLTSTVLLEALSQGVPVVCPDHCGFSDVVTSACGIKVPLKNPHQLASGIASAIKRLAGNEEERRFLAEGALERIEAFSWEKKACKINGIYSRLTKNRS
ncbi:MAG: glycosyltransferase [Thermodesulfovibrionales bacterium]